MRQARAEHDSGCDRSVCADPVRPGIERRQASRLDQRPDPYPMGRPGGADLLLPVGVAGGDSGRPRSQQRLHQHRHTGPRIRLRWRRTGAPRYGPCLTINCGRGAASTQFSFRLSKRMPVAGGSRLEAIAELFNVFNASHPSNPSMVNNRRFLGTVQRPEVNQDFMQPASFSGDFQRPEQRVGQLALRWTF